MLPMLRSCLPPLFVSVAALLFAAPCAFANSASGDAFSVRVLVGGAGRGAVLGRRRRPVHQQRLFGRLVSLGEGTEDTRRRVTSTDLGGDTDTTAVVNAFGAQ